MRSSIDVHNHLLERDVPHELFPARGRLRTPERIAAVLGLPKNQVGKVVVYESDGQPVAALVASDRAPDENRLRSALGSGEIRPSSRARASELTGYLAEAIPPVGLPGSFRVVMDRPLANEEVLYFHGGEVATILKVRGADLARAADATIAAITA